MRPPLTVQLLHTVEIEGMPPLAQFAMRAPRAGDLVDFDAPYRFVDGETIDVDFARIRAYVLRLSDLLPEQVDAIDGEDFTNISLTIVSFFRSARPEPKGE